MVPAARAAARRGALRTVHRRVELRLHTRRVVHQEAHLPGVLGGHAARAHQSHLRHAHAERVAQRGQLALLRHVHAQEDLQEASARRVRVHGAGRSRPHRQDARAGPEQARDGRGGAAQSVAERHRSGTCGAAALPARPGLSRDVEQEAQEVAQFGLLLFVRHSVVECSTTTAAASAAATALGHQHNHPRWHHDQRQHVQLAHSKQRQQQQQQQQQ